MRLLLVLLSFGLGCAAQTAVFTCHDVTDSRCISASGILTLTFSQLEGAIPDYGIQVDAAISGGTFTVGTVPAPCPLFGGSYPGVTIQNQSSAANVTSLSTSTALSIAPYLVVGGVGPYPTFPCAANPTGYTYDVPFVSGGTTVLIHVRQIVKFRAAAAVPLNGFGVPDYAVSGASQLAITQPNGYTWDFNSLPCALACDPGTFSIPAKGSTGTDDYGNTYRIISDALVTQQEAGKTPTSVGNTKAMLSLPDGNAVINDTTTGATLFTPAVLSHGDYYWSPSDDNVLYTMDDGASHTGFRVQRITFGGATVDSGTSLDSYGRFCPGSGGHQNGTREGWMPFCTYKDYAITGTVAGNVLTRTSGTAVDAALVGQWDFTDGLTIASVNVGSQTVTFASAPSTTFQVARPFNHGAIKDNGAGTAYTVIAGDTANNPVGILTSLNIGNGGPTPGPGAGTDRNIWMAGSASSGTFEWGEYFNPLTDTALHFSVGLANYGNIYSRTCNAAIVGTGASTVPVAAQCNPGSHTAMTQFSDGTIQNINPQPGEISAFLNFQHIANPSAGSDLSQIYSTTSNAAGEYAGAVGTASGGIAPFSVDSTNWAGQSGGNNFPFEYAILSAIGSPAVATLNTALSSQDAAMMLANGVNVSNITGCTNLNGAAKPVSAASGTSITFTSENCAGGFTGTPTWHYGFVSVYKPTLGLGGLAVTDFTLGDMDVARISRNNFVYLKVGHSRSIPYCPVPNGCANPGGIVPPTVHSDFYAVPRGNICFDGRCYTYSSNFGMPGAYRFVIVTLPWSWGGAGITDNCFIIGSCFTMTTTATSITVNMTTPTTGSALVELVQSDATHGGPRWSDVRSAADPTVGATCPTGSAFNLSMAGSLTKNACDPVTLKWTAGAPDSTYQVAMNTTGSTTKTTTFTGLTQGVQYGIRVIADNKAVAIGSITASGVIPPAPPPVASGGATLSGRAFIN